MSRVELRRTGPARPRARLVAPLEREVAELEVEVVAQLGIQLRGSLVGFEGVVVAAGPIEEIGQVLRDLGQRWILAECRSQLRLRCGELSARFYRSFIHEVTLVSSPREAEMSKLIENTFRHVNVALVNELAMYAIDLDTSIWAAIDAD